MRYAEYLAEVRERVCTRCPERKPGQPFLTRRCRRCGIELQLSEIVEGIHEGKSKPTGAGPVAGRRLVCSRCVHHGGGNCPCPCHSLHGLILRAVADVDERCCQRELMRKYLARLNRKDHVPVEKMIEAYEAATGTCVSCD